MIAAPASAIGADSAYVAAMLSTQTTRPASIKIRSLSTTKSLRRTVCLCRRSSLTDVLFVPTSSGIRPSYCSPMPRRKKRASFILFYIKLEGLNTVPDKQTGKFAMVTR